MYNYVDYANFFCSSVSPHNVRVSKMLLEQMEGSSYDKEQICGKFSTEYNHYSIL